MKRILLLAFLLLAFAVPAWGQCTLTWTNAVGNASWNVAGNWLDATEPPCEPAHAPNTGDTVQFLDGNLALPSLGLPNAGEVFVLVIDGNAAGAPWTQNLTAFCGALNWNYSSLTVGASGRNADSINLDKDSAASGTITAWGTVPDDGVPTAIANAAITVKVGGILGCLTTNWAITQPITIEAGGILYAVGVTLLANGGVNLAGTLDISVASSVLDVGTLPLTCTGNAVILWGGEGDILGGLNAGGFAVTHTGETAANSITCDVAGTLNLGTTTANSIAVTVTAATTIGNSFACGSLAHSAGAMTGASKTITAPGGYTMSGTASIAGTLNVVCGAGAYTQTGGTVAADAVLNVTTGSGGFTYTALTRTGTLNITTVGNATVAAWNAATASGISLLTLGAGTETTLSGVVAFSKIAGSGTLTGGANVIYFNPTAVDAWAYTGTTTGTGLVTITPFASLALTGAVDVGPHPVLVDGWTLDRTFTLPGLVCGNLTIRAATATKTMTVAITGNSSGAAIALGASTDKYGAVTFGSAGVHKWTGAIARAGTGTANALNLQGRCIFTGTMTGTGVVVTPTREGQIDCMGTGVVTNVTATGNRLVVRRAVDAAGMPLRSWQGGTSNVNVRFLPRKEIGSPGVN